MPGKHAATELAPPPAFLGQLALLLIPSGTFLHCLLNSPCFAFSIMDFTFKLVGWVCISLSILELCGCGWTPYRQFDPFVFAFTFVRSDYRVIEFLITLSSLPSSIFPDTQKGAVIIKM